MEWRWVIYIEGGREIEAEAGLSEGERERGPGLCCGAKLLDATLLCMTRVNNPQMIFKTTGTGDPSLKIVDTWKQWDLHLKRCYNLITPVLFACQPWCGL